MTSSFFPLGKFRRRWRVWSAPCLRAARRLSIGSRSGSSPRKPRKRGRCTTETTSFRRCATTKTRPRCRTKRASRYTAAKRAKRRCGGCGVSMSKRGPERCSWSLSSRGRTTLKRTRPRSGATRRSETRRAGRRRGSRSRSPRRTRSACTAQPSTGSSRETSASGCTCTAGSTFSRRTG